jgi:hypothetical protein
VVAIRHLKGAGTVLVNQTNDEGLHARITSFISLCGMRRASSPRRYEPDARGGLKIKLEL